MRERRPGQCWELGPWESRCTQPYTHRYAHYDAHSDQSFASDWRDWFDDDALAQMTTVDDMAGGPRNG